MCEVNDKTPFNIHYPHTKMKDRKIKQVLCSGGCQWERER
jgi:hypothetical protein